MTSERICPACARSFEEPYAMCPHCFPPRPFIAPLMEDLARSRRLANELLATIGRAFSIHRNQQ